MDQQLVIDFGIDVLQSYRSEKTNRILLQTGNVVGEEAESDNVEHWQHVGFASRPSKPKKGKVATQALVIRRGSRDVAFASCDQRSLELYGLLDHGETAVSAAGPDGEGQARSLYKKDGSINHFTTSDNTKDGKSVYERIAPDGFSWVAPWGTLKFDATGLHVTHASGATFNLGGIGGLPPPFDAISSYISMQAGTVENNAVMQSNGAGANFPLANATAVVAALRAVEAEFIANLAAWQALAKILPIAEPSASALVTARAAAKLALELVYTQIPTTTTSA